MSNPYLPAGYQPHAKSSRELYAEAMKELAFPAPALKLTEYPQLDAMTGGLRVREFSILCGATGVGKTALLANLSASWIKQGAPHFVASVETGPTDFLKRILSVMERKDLNGGDAVHVDELKRIHVAHGAKLETGTLHLSLYDNRFSVETLMADISWHVEQHGIKVAIIDNLNFFLEITRSSDQLIEMDRVIHELIIFCKQVDVHVIMVMHPKKTDHGRVESEFDIKGSSTAVQEAHNVFLFNRPRESVIEARHAEITDRELKIAKMRRRGKYVGRSLVLRCRDSVSYSEGVIL
jgi:replicative DNA helicase